MRAVAIFGAVVVAAALLTACGGRRRLTCERPIRDLPTTPGAVLWFGEMHGTEESPRFVTDVACTVARYDRVQIGLEIWQDETLRIQQYLMDGNRAALLSGPFWKQHDGRSSLAMVALLDRVRDLRTRGARLEVVAYDITNEPDRDRAMADAVLAARDEGATFIGLSGNIHSRRTPWNSITPLVAHLVAAKLPVTTYDVAASGGTMWSCLATDDHEPVCGSHPNGRDTTKGMAWTLGPARDSSHDGTYFVGDTKASPPAVP